MVQREGTFAWFSVVLHSSLGLLESDPAWKPGLTRGAGGLHVRGIFLVLAWLVDDCPSIAGALGLISITMRPDGEHDTT